jgi:PBP1b-binding outer membrane lipoprotein LpoB
MKNINLISLIGLAVMLAGCNSSTPAPTEQGKKDFMGRKPTAEELKAAQDQAADRMKEVGAGGSPATTGN